MEKTLQIGKTKWISIQAPEKKDIDKIAKKYDLHEIIINDLLGINVQSKIENSNDHFFLALSFTKYFPEKGRYLFNELDVVIGEDYIISTTWFESKSFDDLFDDISKEAESYDHGYKSSPYYILYRIIDNFYDKSMKSLSFSSQKLLDIQNDLSDQNIWKEMIDDLVSEDLNKILIKHNFLSQRDVINDLVNHINWFHEKHLVVYFNDLKVKLSRIINNINVLTEKNDSLMNAYNTFIGIKNNNIVTRLTFINAIFMPLTLIAGIWWMSEWSMMTGPENRKIAYPAFFVLCGIVSLITYRIIRSFSSKKR